MRMYSQLAWRNIWRNPRRTMVMMTAVVIGVWSMIVLSALMRGMEVEMIQNSLKTLTGNLQIHHPAYREDPVVQNSLADLETIHAVLSRSLPAEARWSKRIRVDAVVSNARHSAGVTLVGIQPVKEKAVSFIGKAVTEGRYLAADDTNKIIVGKALLEKFETEIGHKLVLMSPGMDHAVASRAFRIVGTFRADMETTEKRFVFVNLPAAQEMLKMGRRISEIAVTLPHPDLEGQQEKEIAANLKSGFSDAAYAVETWLDLLPMMREYIGIFDGFIYIWYLIMFIAMGFGLVNTLLMAVYERMREFGLLKALGMKPLAVIRGVVTESFFLLIIGILIGNLLGMATVRLVARTGIDLSALAAGVEMWGMPRVLVPEIWGADVAVAGVMVLLLGLIVSIYPAFTAARFTPVEAMGKH